MFVEIEAYRVVVARCWREETRSTLVGLEKLRMLMEAERSCLGSVATRSRPVLVSGGRDETVRVWDLASGSPRGGLVDGA